MFSIPHLIVIFVVVLIVFGPEKLPDLARNLGKVMGEFRRATGELRSTFEDHLRDIEREASMRAAAAAAANAGGAIAPTEQNTIGQPKLGSAPGTVTGEAPRGWAAAGPGNTSSGENAAAQDAAASENVAVGETQATQAAVTAQRAEPGRIESEHVTSEQVNSEHSELEQQQGGGESAKATVDQGKEDDGGTRPA